MNMNLAAQAQGERLFIKGKEYSFARVWHNLPAQELARHIAQRGEGSLTSKGVAVCGTGQFTGRSPRDRFIVRDETTRNIIDWGKINQPITTEKFTSLTERMIESWQRRRIYVRDVLACSRADYSLKVRVVSTTAYHNLFARNMFLPVAAAADFIPDITVLVDPHFEADPRKDQTRSKRFIILNIAAGLLCIGGTGYTGEVKKGIFTLFNYLLPHHHSVLSMHCGANMKKDGASALFFGLSGTGKTTLSSDPHRLLIGDDEHGWDHQGIFNLEGGCYAKVINLEEEKEPLIWNAIRPGALLENTILNQNEVDYTDASITENTRVSYPLEHIENRAREPMAPHPRDIFFLSCDAFGVLPPLSLLTEEQAILYFLCGYTARIAGTEQGIKEPAAVFSSCFGSPFLPLPPHIYAAMLKEKIARHRARVWLVNTGWTGGPYGVGKRISLQHTRSLLRAALEDKIHLDSMKKHSLFNLAMPSFCPEVPQELLNPSDSWNDKSSYERQARKLKEMLDEQARRFSL